MQHILYSPHKYCPGQETLDLWQLLHMRDLNNLSNSSAQSDSESPPNKLTICCIAIHVYMHAHVYVHCIKK